MQIPSHNIAATIYNLSINLLDKQLSTLVFQQKIASNALIILTYFLKLNAKACIENIINEVVQTQDDQNWTGKRDFISVLEQLATNPIYKTQQILDTCYTSNEDLAFFIIKELFSKPDTYRVF